MSLTLTFDGVVVTNAESETNWDSSGLLGPELFTDVLEVQGSSCVGFMGRRASGYAVYQSPVSYDFTTTYEGAHVFMWVLTPMPNAMSSEIGEGVFLIVGSSTSDYVKFQVGSGDEVFNLSRGFKRFILDPTLTPTEVVGTPDFSAISVFGVWCDISDSTMYLEEIVFFDSISIGYGLRVTGTSSNFWSDVEAANKGPVNNHGILQEFEGVFYLYAPLHIGSLGALDTTVSDQSKIVKLVSQRYYTGSAWVDMLADGFLGITIDDGGASGGTTSFTDGVQLEPGVGALGSHIEGSDVRDSFFEASLENVSSQIELKGTAVYHFSGVVSLPSASASLKACSATFHGCAKVTLGSAFLRNVLFCETVSPDAALLWNPLLDIEDCTFSANTTGSAIEMPENTGNPYEYDNLKFVGNTYDVYNSSGGTVEVDLKNGANAASSTGDTVVFNNPVVLHITGSVSLLGAEVRIYDLDSAEVGNLGTELAGVETNPNTFFDYSGAEGNLIWIQILKTGYLEIGVEYTIPAQDTSIPIQLRIDKNL